MKKIQLRMNNKGDEAIEKWLSLQSNMNWSVKKLIVEEINKNGYKNLYYEDRVPQNITFTMPTSTPIEPVQEGLPTSMSGTIQEELKAEPKKQVKKLGNFDCYDD